MKTFTRRIFPSLVAGTLLASAIFAAPNASAGANPFDGPQYPVAPYISPSYLTPSDQRTGSFLTQPWRGYMNTVPASQMLAGIGIVYDPPDGTDNDAMLHQLANAGVKSIRFEQGWGGLTPDETSLLPGRAQDLNEILAACKKYGIVPTILLNANSGYPMPMATMRPTVTADAAVGARQITLSNTTKLKVGYSGLSDVPDKSAPAASILFTAVDGNTVTLSKPLPIAIAANTPVTVQTFPHLPLYPVGTPQFTDTANAFTNYALVINNYAKGSGIGTYNLEIWNELTFGSETLNINHYYETPLFPDQSDVAKPGGPAYAMGAQTAAALHASSGPGMSVIWGFSNTSALPNTLPGNLDGMSRHPYHTNFLTTGGLFADAPRAIPTDGPTDFQFAQPEGLMATGIFANNLPSSELSPAAKAQQAIAFGNSNFKNVFTENGGSPSALGITDQTANDSYKTKLMLRNYAFWLNKGIDQVDLYALYRSDPTSFGLLGTASTPDTSSEFQALTRYTNSFHSTSAITKPRQLDIDVAAVGTQYAVDPDFATPLWYRDLFAFLPYQVSNDQFVVPVYTMTPNMTKALPGGTMNYRVTLKGFTPSAQVSMFDPITNTSVPAPILASDANGITIGVTTTDYPRLLKINASGTSTTTTSTTQPGSTTTTARPGSTTTTTRPGSTTTTRPSETTTTRPRSTTTTTLPAQPPVAPAPPKPQGYWLTAADGGVFSFGDTKFYGSTGSMKLNKPIVSSAASPTGNGYWFAGSDGGVFAFGDTKFLGSMGSSHLNKPVVGMAATPSGNGYWLVASDGGIFAYGDAKFYGSMGSSSLNKPVVGMTATPTGKGYWLVASDGGIFAYGDAKFYGSTGSITLNKPIVAMQATASGNGYWFVASDGGVFNYGDAAFYGSAANTGQNIVGLARTADGGGYWLATSSGAVLDFGDAPNLGSMADANLNQGVFGILALG